MGKTRAVGWNDPSPSGLGDDRISSRRIGLVCNGAGPSDEAVKYAIAICESLGAQLDVLNFGGDDPEQGHLSRLLTHLYRQEIRFRILTTAEEKKKEILRYAQKGAGALFVVIDEASLRGTMTSRSGGSLDLSSWDMECPLVVISGAKRRTKGAPDTAARVAGDVSPGRTAKKKTK